MTTQARRKGMRRPLMRLAFIVVWLLCVAALAGWLVDAVHRSHLGGVVIVATGLAVLVIVPLLRSRVNQPPPP